MFGFFIVLVLLFVFFVVFFGWFNLLFCLGGWMNLVKVVLGFLELVLAFKFFLVVDMMMYWGILFYEVFLGVWILVFVVMIVYFFGWIKFLYDSFVKKLLFI